MFHHLKRDLERLEKRLLFLAAEVEESVRRSMTALHEHRADIAQEVIDHDQEIDRREVELEEDCLKVLALHQPVATDLRFVAACLKIDNDLERIGDLACNIAERALGLGGMRAVELFPRFTVMMEATVEMLRDSINAFVQNDPDAAREVCERDDQVDAWNRDMIRDLLAWMHKNPQSIEQALELISVSKNLERIADHATNIAEDVVYLVEGEIIRHQA